MIEFNGYINGKTEKYFFKKNKRLLTTLFLISYALLVFPIAIFALKARNWYVLVWCGVMLIAIVLMQYIPMSKKKKIKLTPHRIYTDTETITCVSEKVVDTKFIGDEKAVLDYGEFYEIIYPIGNASNGFICQKDLLTQGTLEEFESLFEGKIERRY